MPKTVDTVESIFRKIRFICCAQNTVETVIRKIDFLDNMKDGLYNNIKLVM